MYQSNVKRLEHSIPQYHVEKELSLEMSPEHITPIHAVRILVNEVLLKEEKSKSLPGVAPAGDLERKIQEWLDSKGEQD